MQSDPQSFEEMRDVVRDICALRGWVAVYIPKSAGSVFDGGHVNVHYRGNGAAHVRMLYADTRLLKQFLEFVEDIDSHPPSTQRTYTSLETALNDV